MRWSFEGVAENAGRENVRSSRYSAGAVNFGVACCAMIYSLCAA